MQVGVVVTRWGTALGVVTVAVVEEETHLADAVEVGD